MGSASAKRSKRPASGGSSRSLLRTATTPRDPLSDLARRRVKLARAALCEQQLTLPFGAPRTMFNVKIGGARRCAAQSWSLDRRQARQAGRRGDRQRRCDGDVRRCSALLPDRADALPDTPLIAMVPVSLRSEAEAHAGGNMVGSILCNLATDVEDPALRLATISESMRQQQEGVLRAAQDCRRWRCRRSAVAPWLWRWCPASSAPRPPPFNIVISNVPGPREPMYWRGARLDGNYPLSIAMDGQALNITLVNNADNLDFGLVGCRRSVPHLQRLLGHLEDVAQRSRTRGRRLTVNRCPSSARVCCCTRPRTVVVEVLIAHPGGPFWARKDDGAWSIPKGEYERRRSVGCRAPAEFVEELGSGAGRARVSTSVRSSNPAARWSPPSRCGAISTSPKYAAIPSNWSGRGDRGASRSSRRWIASPGCPWRGPAQAAQGPTATAGPAAGPPGRLTTWTRQRRHTEACRRW